MQCRELSGFQSGFREMELSYVEHLVPVHRLHANIVMFNSFTDQSVNNYMYHKSQINATINDLN